MKNKRKNKKHILIPLIIAIASLILYVALNFNSFNIKSKQYVKFLKDVDSKTVESVLIGNSPTILVELQDGTKYKTDNPRSENFKEFLLKEGIDVKEASAKPLSHTLPMVLFTGSLIVFFVVLSKNSKMTKQGVFSASNVNADEVENIDVTFDDVAGNEEAKESVKDIVDFLKNPEKYAKYGARMPKGIIFYGEPGTGKTLLAKAVAGEAGVPFFAVTGSDFVQMYVGVGAARIRNLFKKARAKEKAVIFIDEIDAIGKRRDGANGNGSSDEKDQTLNALLTEMSGFNEKEGIVVIAATNRLDMLDTALLRPGRFDRHIEISLPDVAAREKIIDLHMKNKPFKNVNIKDLAYKTSYFSGAKLESLINEAAILACKEEKEFISEKELDKAFSIVIAGHEKVNRDHIKEHDRALTAYHEIGHALVSLNVLPESKVSKITIIPSTKGAGGYTLSIPEDRMYQTKSSLKNDIKVLLGGRAAEEIIYGNDNITTGAYNDLQRVTKIAVNMIAQYGMSDTSGLLNIAELNNMGIKYPGNNLKECEELVSTLYEETKQLLLENKDKLNEMTKELIEKETLFEEDIEKYKSGQ